MSIRDFMLEEGLESRCVVCQKIIPDNEDIGNGLCKEHQYGKCLDKNEQKQHDCEL